MHRVLEIVGDGSPGGGTTAVLGLSRGLKDRGLAVTIASQRDSYIIREARDSGLDILELDFGRRRSSLGLALALGRYIRQSGVALTHAHGARAGLPVSLLPRGLRMPFVYTVHGFHYPRKPAGVRHMARQAERLCMRHADATIFVSGHDLRLAQYDRLTRAGKTSRIIYNGVGGVPDLVVPDEHRRFDIAYLGRLYPKKGCLLIPEILTLLRPAKPRVAFIGGGKLEEQLRDRLVRAGLEEQVSFLGERPRSEALRLLAQARIMILPSLSEGLPMSIIEAMHLAIPTVASRVGGIPELIEDGETGYLADAGDAQGFAGALRALLENRVLRQTMGVRAQRHARASFTLARNTDEHLSLYTDLLVQRDASPAMADAA